MYNWDLKMAKKKNFIHVGWYKTDEWNISQKNNTIYLKNRTNKNIDE